jgi:hypothetical protein
VDNKGSGTPLTIRGKNFSPLMQAMKIIDDNKTQNILDQYAKEMKKLVGR